MEQLELTEQTLRERRGAKWRRYSEAVLPAWVADMDFAVAEPIQRAVQRAVDHQEYGYPWMPPEDRVEKVFVERMNQRYGWQPDRKRIRLVINLVQALNAAILAYSQPGEGVVIQTPIYPPFLILVKTTDRRQVINPLIDDGNRLVVDIEGLARSIDDSTRIILLCNPHNPTGRALERSELEAIGQLAIERDLVIVSDEIHSDLMYQGGQHLPIATLGEDIASRTVTLTAATKAFNIPGLGCGLMHFGSEDLYQRFQKVIPEYLLGRPDAIASDATVAAWREGGAWLQAVLSRLTANRERVAEWVEATPGVRFYKPEATYLAWLDCCELNLPGSSAQEFFLDQAKVGLVAGQDLEVEGGHGFVRFNFATSPTILDQLLERMTKAIQGQAR